MSGGVATALEQAVKDEAEMSDLVQAGLFEELDEHDTGSLTAPSPLSAALTSTGKRGRPKGAKNRRTEAVTAWLLQQHRHPLKVMMEAYSMTTADLAAALGLAMATETLEETTVTMIDGKAVETVTKREVETNRYSNDVLLDLFKLQVRMAEAVAPYVAQKMGGGTGAGDGNTLSVSFAQLNIGGGGVSSPARGDPAEIPAGGGMSVRLGASRTPEVGP